MTEWPHAYINTPTLRIHYVRRGEGVPLILLHGWPEFWYTWRKNIPVLAERFDVMAPDLRGFGDTEKPATEPTVATYVDDVIAFADALGLDRFGIVGHDVGAFVMQDVARKVPDRIRGLFFFNCPHPGIGKRWVERSHYQELWYQTFHQQDWTAELVGHDRETCRIYFRHFLRHWSHRDDTFDEDVDTWVDNFMKPGNLQGGFDWYRAVATMRREVIVNGPPVLETIRPKSYILWGRHDPILRAEWADNVDEYFDDVTVEIAEDAGHFVHYEQPELANTRMKSFFESLTND